MIKKLIIVGTGNTSAQISRLISVNEFKGIRKDSIKGYLSFNKKEKIFAKKKCKFFFDIKKFDKRTAYFISITDIFFRHKIVNILIKKKLKIINLISKSSLVYDSKIGYGNLILPKTIIHNNTDIKNSNFFFSFVNIAHDNKIGSFNNFQNYSSTSGKVKIKDLNYFFEYSNIYPKISVGSKCLIYQRKSVTKNLKNYEIKK